MTQALKNQDYDSRQDFERSIRKRQIQEEYKNIILNYLFRNVAFINQKGKIRTIPKIIQREMSSKLRIEITTINKIINKFLDDLVHIKQFVENNGHFGYSKNQIILVQVYLHKLYRLAPVFDFKRARENAKILRRKLNAHYFWPRVSTQVAVVLFITDKLDSFREKKILQTNLRTFCNCSAYAFHRTRNKLGIN